VRFICSFASRRYAYPLLVSVPSIWSRRIVSLFHCFVAIVMRGPELAEILIQWQVRIFTDGRYKVSRRSALKFMLVDGSYGFCVIMNLALSLPIDFQNRRPLSVRGNADNGKVSAGTTEHRAKHRKLAIVGLSTTTQFHNSPPDDNTYDLKLPETT
jgi:hypothetical protein